MNSILQAAADLLKSRDLQPAFTEDGDLLIVRCGGEHLSWTTSIDTCKNGSVVTLLSRVAVIVPPAKRGACAKLLARLNYGKRLGAFHLDLRDGEVLYCISNVITADILPEETLDTLMRLTFAAMNERAPEVFSLVYGNGQGPDSEPAAPSPSRILSATPPDINN
jgi:hypothetical protein